LSELRPIIVGGTPWGFLGLSAYVDFLAKLAWGEDKKSSGYKDFFEDWFPERYRNFEYDPEVKDLPLQFYHVLRCGICHSFSLVPDAKSLSSGGRRGSIVISHDGIDASDGTVYAHLSKYTKNGKNAAVLLAGTLCDDLVSVVDRMFRDQSVQANAESWVTKFPPIASI